MKYIGLPGKLIVLKTVIRILKKIYDLGIYVIYEDIIYSKFQRQVCNYFKLKAIISINDGMIDLPQLY